LLEDIVKDCTSWSELFKRYYGKGQPNGRVLTTFIKNHSYLDTKHFDKKASTRKHKDVDITCPVCDKEFKTKSGGSKARKTCSYACSNSHFRSGQNNGNWNEDYYRTTCFLFHKKECVVCGEDLIVEAHHYDENHENNLPENLVPLCPTHHRYWHSRYKHLVVDKVDQYVASFKKEQELKPLSSSG
jgi:hypothetical protein